MSNGSDEIKDAIGVFAQLRARHPAPAWAFMEEVRNGTGFAKTVRTADALAMSLFPSRGLSLHGFEVKVSRADWIKERDEPAKAEEIYQFCHFWWLVVADAKIVKDGELPIPWGLLVSDGTKLKVVKQAALNEHVKPPTHLFLGAILRKFAATETANALVDDAFKRGHDKGWSGAMAVRDRNTEDGRAKAQLEELRALVGEFEERSGVRISKWDLPKVGDAVRLLTRGHDSPLSRLEYLARDAESIAAAARAAFEQARGIELSDAKASGGSEEAA